MVQESNSFVFGVSAAQSKKMAPAPTVMRAITIAMKPVSPEERGLGFDLPAAPFAVAETEAEAEDEAEPVALPAAVALAVLEPERRVTLLEPALDAADFGLEAERGAELLAELGAGVNGVMEPLGIPEGSPDVTPAVSPMVGRAAAGSTVQPLGV